MAEQAAAIEHLVTDEPAHTLGAHVGDGAGADVARKMAQGFIDGQRVLLAVG